MRYIIICTLGAGGVIGSVTLFQYIGHYSSSAANTQSNENRVAKLMADAERYARGRKRQELKNALEEVARIRPDYELHNRDFIRLSKKLAEMY